MLAAGESSFPAIRENNRKFFDFGLFFRAIVLKIACNSGGYEGIPYAAEQGKFVGSGNFFLGTGNNHR
jgi:hypothetical protein